MAAPTQAEIDRLAALPVTPGKLLIDGIWTPGQAGETEVLSLSGCPGVTGRAAGRSVAAWGGAGMVSPKTHEWYNWADDGSVRSSRNL